MEKTHLKGFEVSGFKKFEKLLVEDIGQFNLIVGDNNSGKTSLLEALLADTDTPLFLEYLFDILYHIKKFTNLNNNFLFYYLSSSQDKYPQKTLFKLITNDDNYEVIKYTKINSDQIFQHYVKNHPPAEDDDGVSIQQNFNSQKQFNYNSPFIPFGPLYSHQLTKIYGEHIQLFVNKKESLLESLSYIIKNIKNIEVNASYSHDPILLVSEKMKNRLSPLATYGDGTLKLFRILLSLFSSNHYNRLMIDEIDTGVHYSRLKDFLKSLLLVAKEQGKQIFATTHSKECVEYFKEALSETSFEKEGRIIRLADTANGSKAYTMRFNEFETAINAESEIR
jgi:AAA15 family ATPase/GTPase